MKYIFFTALWEGTLGHSKAYFDRILDLQLSIIEEELQGEEVEYHIVGTRQSDVDYYSQILRAKRQNTQSSQTSHSTQPIFSVVPIPDSSPPQIKLNYLSQQFIKERENSGDVLIYNVPDYVYSRGTFKWVKENLNAGKKICSIYTPKVIRELALEQISDLNSIQLWESVHEALHEGHLKQFTDSDIGFIKYPSGIYYRTETGHVCFPVTMHPFAFILDKRYSDETYRPQMSIEQGLQSCYLPADFAYQNGVSDFLVLELTRMDLPWADDTDYSGYSHELIANWFRFGQMGELQRMFLHQQVLFGTVRSDAADSFQTGLLEYLDEHYYNHRN